MLRSKTTSRAVGKLQPRRLVAAIFCVIATSATFAQPTAPETTLRLLIEPAYMRPELAEPLPGSNETVLTPAIQRGGEITYLTRSDVDRLKLNGTSLHRVAGANASAELAQLQPEFVRDEKGVIQYAILSSDSPATASAVLAPDFAAKFADTLGPDLLVAIPNRYRVYVYPALASKFEETSGLVLSDFEMSPYPVSREIFRVTPSGLRGIGTFGGQ